MAEEKFILASLEDSKDLGEIISNKTSKRILEYLSNKNKVSETALAKELSLPLSTVHYNMEKLKESGLITSKLFKWSEKGNKIYLYSLANKLIIIAPKKIHSDFKDNLKNLLFSVISSFAVLGIIKFISNFSKNMAKDEAPMLASKSQELAPALSSAQTQISLISPEYYFALAIILMVIFYLVFDYISRKVKIKKS